MTNDTMQESFLHNEQLKIEVVTKIKSLNLNQIIKFLNLPKRKAIELIL